MLTRVDPTLDGPMILFQDVIEVLHRSVLAVLLQNTLVFELHNRRRVSGMLAGVDDSRRRTVCSAERFGQKALGRVRVLLGREKEFEGGAGGIHRRAACSILIEAVNTAATLEISLIHSVIAPTSRSIPKLQHCRIFRVTHNSLKRHQLAVLAPFAAHRRFDQP
jgi:hypothetical protein